MQTRARAFPRGPPRLSGQPSDSLPGRYGDADDEFIGRANRLVARFGVRPRLLDAVRAGENRDRAEAAGPQTLIMHGQVVRGDELTVIGNNNSVHGNKCKIVGNSNNLTGDDGDAIGNHNILTGARCSADGVGNIVVSESPAPHRGRDRDRDRDYAEGLRLVAAYDIVDRLAVRAPRPQTGTAFPVFPPGYEDAPSTDDDAPTTCTICSEHIRAVIAIPCGHFAMCGTCCAKLKPEGRKDDAGLHMCPICQKGVSAFNRVFDS